MPLSAPLATTTIIPVGTNMNFKVQIQTVPFALIGTEMEGTVEDAVNLHNDLLEAYNASQKALKGGEGMNEKELDIWVYNMLLGKGNDADVYQKATPAQGKELHRIKRALAKIKRAQSIEDTDLDARVIHDVDNI